MEIDNLLSDIHRPVTVTLKSNEHNALVKCLLSPRKMTHNPMIFKNTTPRSSWKNRSELKRSFLKNLDAAMIGNMTNDR